MSELPREAGTRFSLQHYPAAERPTWFEVLPADPNDPDGQLARDASGALWQIRQLQEEVDRGAVLLLGVHRDDDRRSR